MKHKLTTLFTFIFVIVIWYYTSLKVNHLFVPNPIDVFENLKNMIINGQLQIDIWYTFKRIFIASVISGLISLPLGLLIYNFKVFKYSVDPIINLMRYVPITAFYPLLIMWLGIDEEMKIAFLFIASFVYMLPSTVLALEEINHDLIETGYTIGMSKLQTITRIQLPAMLPSILNSFVMCFGIGFSYSAIVETINAKYGLGFLIQQSSSRGRTDLVFVGIIVIMVISFAFDNIAKFIIKKIFKWRFINDSIE